MTLSQRLALAALGVVSSLAAVNAAPPPGMRWSDQAGLRGSTAGAIARPTGTVAASGQTVTVRGPDGVLRTYPLSNGAVVIQGQGGQSPATLQQPVAPTPPAPMPAPPVKKI